MGLTENNPLTTLPYQEKAKFIVRMYLKGHLDVTDNVKLKADDVYVVWFCKTLQNWKALVSTNLPDGMYYEVTYDGDKKFQNLAFPDELEEQQSSGPTYWDK